MNILSEQSLEGVFYIICVNEANDWWQLRRVQDHQVVACGRGKDYILKALKTQVERYKNKIQLQRQWDSQEYLRPLKDKVKAQRKAEYEVVKDISEDVINSIVTSTKENSFRRRRLNEREVPLQEEEEQENIISVPTVRGTIRRRRLVRK